MRSETLELAPLSDGARFRRATLLVDPDGAVVLRTLDLGASERAAWGLDDEELTLTVAHEDVGRLALALAAEVLAGGEEAVARLASICERHGVDCRIAWWS